MHKMTVTPTAEAFVLDKAELCAFMAVSGATRLQFLDCGLGLFHVGVDIAPALDRLERQGYADALNNEMHPLRVALDLLRTATRTIDIYRSPAGDLAVASMFGIAGDNAMSVTPSPLGALAGYVVSRFPVEDLESRVLSFCELATESAGDVLVEPPSGWTLRAARYVLVREEVERGNTEAAKDILRTSGWADDACSQLVELLQRQPVAFEFRQVQHLDESRRAIDGTSWVSDGHSNMWRFAMSEEEIVTLTPAHVDDIAAELRFALRVKP
jgi:hypothetical protein